METLETSSLVHLNIYFIISLTLITLNSFNDLYDQYTKFQK